MIWLILYVCGGVCVGFSGADIGYPPGGRRLGERLNIDGTDKVDD